MLGAKRKIIIQLLAVFVLFIPFFWNPININIHPDNAIELLDILRLSDSRLTFSLNPSAIYANPFFQILSNDHGIMRSVIFWPIFTLLDAIKIPLTEVTINSSYLIAGFLIFAAVWLLLRKIAGKQKAFFFFALICSAPYIMLMIKIGWWQTYAWLPFIAGLYFLDDYLKKQKDKSFLFFCLTCCWYILATPGFFFGGIFYIIYALVFLLAKDQSEKSFKQECLKIIKMPWTWLPVLLILAEIAAVYAAKHEFGESFGIMLKILSKSDLPPSYGWKTIADFMLAGFGLAGFVLWPAIFAAYFKSIVDFKKSDAFLKSCVIFFTLAFFLLIFVAMGSEAYSYELYFSGLMMLIYVLAAIKNKKLRLALVAILVAAGWTQAILYNINFKPNNFLDNPRYFIERDSHVLDACQTIWCPYHFADIQNTGIKTLGYIARNYLAVSPLPYVSKEKNFKEWPKEFFFYTVAYQASTIHIGRRINDKIQYINKAKIIAAYTPEILKKYPVLLADEKTNQRVYDFLAANPRYKLEAIVTIGNVPVIKIYELDGAKPLQTFPVEIYDRKFDQLYSNLKNLGHIDLGNI
ncbi:MAG: hypothetical protein PHO56_04690 [Patescibacteria group bacterium]|nr:hypothetical protein [Patescibacteria group bacterium]